MRRIRNSVKAIIVSLCLVVIFAGSIVGVVLSNKNKPGNNDNPGGNTNPIESYELTEDQKKFAEAVNKNANFSTNIVTEYNENDFVLQDGTVIDKSLIYTIYDEYFISYDNDSNRTAYIKYFDGTKYFYKNVFDFVTEENITYKYFNEYKNGYVSIDYLYENGGNYIYVTTILNISDSSSQVIYRNDFEASEDFGRSTRITSRFAEKYYLAVTSANSGYYEIKIYDYENNNVATYNLNSSIIEDFSLESDYYIFNQDNKIFIGYFDDEFFKFEIEVENFNRYYNFDGFAFVECAKRLNNHSSSYNNYIYSYKLLNYKTGTLTEFKLTDGYSKASFNTNYGYIEVFESKFENDTYAGGLFTYYDTDFNPIIKYQVESSSDNILYVSGSNFLCGQGIITANKSVQAEYIFKFKSENNNFSLVNHNYSALVNENTFVISDLNTDKYKILDIKGNFVFDESFYMKPISYANGYYAVNNDLGNECYILNVLTKTKTLIENYSSDNYFLYNGGGYYLVDNENSLFSLYDYKGNLISDSITNKKFQNVNNGTYLFCELQSGEKLTFYFNRNISITDTENYVTNYVSTNNIKYSNIENYFDWSSIDVKDPAEYTKSQSGSGKHYKWTYYYTDGDWGGLSDDEIESCYIIKIVVDKNYHLSNAEFKPGRNWTTNDGYIQFNHDEILNMGSYHDNAKTSFERKYDDGDYTYWIYGDLLDKNNSEKLIAFDDGTYAQITVSTNNMYIIFSGFSFTDGTHSTTSIPTSGEYDYGRIIDMSGYKSRAGYTWHYWSDNSSCLDWSGDNLYIYPDEHHCKSASFIRYVYANWKVNEYTITIDCNGGTGGDSSKTYYTEGGERNIIPSPGTKLGYTFDGWNITTNCQENASKDKASVILNGSTISIPIGCYGNMAAKANWTANKYTIWLYFGTYDTSNAGIIVYDDWFNADTKESTQSSFTKSVLKISNFYGSYGSTNSSGSPAQVETTISFNYDDVTTILDIYNDYCKTLQPSQSDYKVNTYGIQYKIKGWAVMLSNGDGTSTAYYIHDNTAVKFDDYLIKNGTTITNVVFYAVYEPKEYTVGFYNDIDFGGGSLEYDSSKYNAGELNSTLVNKNDGVECNYTVGDYTYKIASGGSYTFLASNEVSFTLSVNSNAYSVDGNDKEKNYYIFDRIELLNVGYRVNDSTYRYGTVVFTYNGSQWSIVFYKSNLEKAIPNNGVIYSDTGDSIFSSKSSNLQYGQSLTKQTVNGVEYYFFDNNQQSINGIKVGFTGSATTLNFTFFNFGYAGDETKGTDYYPITKKSVEGKGKYGFTIKTYLRSNYQETSDLSYNEHNTKNLDSITNNWDYSGSDMENVNDTSNENFVNGSSVTTTANYFMKSNAIKVEKITLYPGANSTGIIVKYFWLNGKRYVLKKDDNDTKVGYYKLTTTFYKYTKNSYNYYYLTKNLSNDISPTVAVSNSFVAYEAEWISTASATDLTALTSFNVYYDGGSDDNDFIYYRSYYKINKNTTNTHNAGFNNTQVWAFAPQQSLVKSSNNALTAGYGASTKRYELDYYLSKITFDVTDVSLSLKKHIDTTNDIYTYDKFNDIYTGTKYDFAAGAKIKYLGNEFKILQAYQIDVVINSTTRNFVLYFTVRESDNYVMYFIYSTVFDGTNMSITVEYSKCEHEVKIEVSDVEEGANTNSGGVNADIQIYDTEVLGESGVYGTDRTNKNGTQVIKGNYNSSTGNLKNSLGSTKWNSLYYKKTTDVSNAIATYSNKIYSSELRVIKISPISGFLIKSISVELGSTAIMNFDLTKIGLTQFTDKDGEKGGTFFSYTTSSTVGGSGTIYSYLIEYTGTNKVFKTFGFGEGNDVHNTGIYFSETQSNAWHQAEANIGFETVYLLIAGIYDDVSIKVETASFVEFDFEDTNGNLGFDEDSKGGAISTTRYNKISGSETSDGCDHYKISDKGQYFLDLRKLPSDSKRYSVSFDPDDGSLKSWEENSGGYYCCENINAEEKHFFLVYDIDRTGELYPANHGAYYIASEIIDVYQNFEYIKKEEESSPNTAYLINSLTNLSIMIELDDGSNIKLGSQNLFDLQDNEKYYNASLVKKLGNIYRVIFIGESSYFKNSVKIFASGENHSAYFTNGLVYNDDGNDAYGNSDAEDVDESVLETAFQVLKDVHGEYEGRTKDDLQLGYEKDESGNIISNERKLKITDKLTYIELKQYEYSGSYFDGFKLFFVNTPFDRAGINADGEYLGFEFARKYFLYVKVEKNVVELNMNSYLSNGSLGNGTITEAGDDYNKDYYTAYKQSYSHKNDTAQNTVSSGSLDVFGDTRNTLTDFALNVSNKFKNADYFSKYMWIGSGSQHQIYQLDYVDSSRDVYKSSSWFNDTVLTNINYTYNEANNDAVNITQSTSINWQGVKKQQDKPDESGNTVTVAGNNPQISGYNVEFIYNNIPGYYLEYIMIETVDYGLLYISLNEVIGNRDRDTDFVYENSVTVGSSNSKIYYRIEYHSGTDDNNNYDSYYVVQLYAQSSNYSSGTESNKSALAGLSSLGLLSNDVTVNFFSKAYDIEITYNLNTNSNKISTTPAFDDETGTPDKTTTKTQNLTYDTLSVLNRYAEMSGYSFVGWGSQYYNLGEQRYQRFDSTKLVWNASSLWENVTAYFSYKNRDHLYGLGSVGYDYYIKSKVYSAETESVAEVNRRDTTGYFITDTGFASLSSNEENYNFWSAYASEFKQSMKYSIYTGVSAIYQINLYALWKSNVYAVELDFNDANEINGRNNNNNNLNGSTKSEFAFKTSATDYIWNGKNDASGNIYKYSIGNLGYQNSISQKVNDNDTNDLNDVYYCYVAFDTNDWYIVSGDSVSGNLTSAYYSLRDNSTTSQFILSNKLKFIIDRYGYSWLGWFSEKLANTYENKFTDSDDIVFGSSYYYGRSETTGSLEMPYLRGANFESSDETFVTIDEFEKLSDGTDDLLNSTDVYSEVVYKGEEYFRNSKKSYVYHYDYRTGNEELTNLPTGFEGKVIKHTNSDYINGKVGDNYLKAINKVGEAYVVKVYYDTALTLDCYYKYSKNDDGTYKLNGDEYVFEMYKNDAGKDAYKVLNIPGDLSNVTKTVQIAKVRNQTGERANYRYITLYSYWSVNNYNVVIDYRDNDVKDNLIYGIGSSEVTNKSQIETDYSALENKVIDGTGKNYNIHSTYFDDKGYEYILNTAIPERVGYDFIGWSFFFADPRFTSNNNLLSGDLYKYNGVQTASSNYYLCLNSISNNYFVSEDSSSTIFTVYNQTAKKTGSSYNWTYYLSEISSNKYTQLNTNNEVFGDAEGDGNRYIYIFALWRAQTFTINVNLNIDTEDLINGYDQDSAYSVGFYDGCDKEGNIEAGKSGYVGINSLFTRQKLVQGNAISDYSNVFAEVVSNLTFVIAFDESFATAKFTDPNAETSVEYLLADLFAVSTGYYLIDWLYKSNDSTSILIANGLRTEYGYYSNIVNNKSGTRTTASDLENNGSDKAIFDINFYKKLYNTNYKKVEEGDNFEQNNTNKLADNESKASTTRVLTDGLNASFASTNFGYVTIDGKNYYIQIEFVDKNGDGRTDSNYLYFKYDGVKYYVVYYVVGEYSKTILENDLTYLYYPVAGEGNAVKKYVVRYDSDGNAYYVPNTVYDGKVQLDLHIAIFSDSIFNGTNGSDIQYTSSTDKSKIIDTYNLMKNTEVFGSSASSMSFVSKTTRQFSIYAHWEVKDDFKVSYTNGNNAVQEKNEYGQKSNVSNEGLAGYYVSYLTKRGALHDSTTPKLTTIYKASAGGSSFVYGYSATTIEHTYETYDSFGFDLVPYFNGRFVSEISIEFDRLESSAINNAAYGYVDEGNLSNVVIDTYSKVKYKLTLSFTWDNVDHTVKVSEVSIYRLNKNLDGTYSYTSALYTIALDTDGNIVRIKQYGADADAGVVANRDILYSYLSLLDKNSFGGENQTFFTISDYYSADANSAKSNEELKMRNGSLFNRRDVNLLKFDFSDLMSSVYVTCKFSVQTYNLQINHIFDEKGDTLIQSTSDKNIYTTQFTELTKGEQYDPEDSLNSSEVYNDTNATGKNQSLATIPTNLIVDTNCESFDVPYGYFIYGVNYDSALVGYRPMDDYYGQGSSINYKGTLSHSVAIDYKDNNGATQNEKASFDGFNFIYSDSNYTKGKGGNVSLILDGDIGDAYADQGSPLLGSTVIFPTKSIRFNKSFYLFKGWFEFSGLSGGYYQFDIYNNVDEATYLSRNIVLYGYYYSNNTPTNIQFYTWNNDWSENSPAYLPYSNNSDEYVLSSSNEASPYIVSDGYLAPSADAVEYVDDEGRLILKSNVEYGVDSSRFSLDEYTGYELSNSNAVDLALLNKILKTYWYYEETYTILYSNIGGEKVYIKYDPEVRSEYEYVPLSGGTKGVIVNTEQYEKFLKDGVTSYEKLADTTISGSSGTAKLKNGSTVTISYDETFSKYYFLYNGKYYIFKVDGATKDTVITKNLMKKNAFYYEDSLGKVTQVKVNSSDDMTNVRIFAWNSSTEKYDKEYPVTQEVIYSYDERFKGAELYISIGAGETTKYYKYHEVPESEIENASSESFLKKYKPRYYVEISGTKYYTMIRKATNSSSYVVTDLFSVDASGKEHKYSGTYNIDTLNNYFVVLNETYYKINYKQIEDVGGSYYINPLVFESTVVLPYGNSTETYYFDYSKASKTSGLYEKYSDSRGYQDVVLFKYNIYTPISKSYSLNAVLKNNLWVSSDVTLNSFPSLNMDYWYNNPEYVLLGYLNVSDMDIEIMKRNEEQGAVFENSSYLYVSSLNKMLETTYDTYVANPSGNYSEFATIDWINNKLTLAESGRALSIYQDTDDGRYYFIHTADDGSTIYYYFDKGSNNQVQIKHEQGGQIYNAYSDYINYKYSGNAYESFRNKLKELVSKKIGEFNLGELLRAPLFVNSYQLSSIDYKTIERVIVNISSQYTLTLTEEELRTCYTPAGSGTYPAGVIAKGDGTYEITLSATFNYAFGLVTTKTQISTSIYAIPVFVPDVIKFVKDDVVTDCVVKDGNFIKIDYSKMNITHYDIANQKLYQSDFVWTLPALPSGSTSLMQQEREALIQSADYLQFVMINKTQFDSMQNSDVGCDVMLDSIIYENNLDVISQKTLSLDNQVLSFDVSTLEDGNYYIFAFYYPIGTAQNTNKHIHRVSDNYIRVTVESGNVVTFGIYDNTMAQS